MGNVNKAQNRKNGFVVSKDFKTVDFPLKQNVSPHGRVTAVSMMKDEGPFVLEWIAHHLAVGFTDLVVYTNDCSDGTDDMLFRLEQLGLAHHRRNVIAEGIRPQPSALKHAQADPLVQASDWLLVFDADEFLCIRHGDGSIDGMISSAKDVGANGIVITWRTYGSSGVHEWSRAPVTEQYLNAAPTTWNKGWGVKTLFAFDPEYWKLGIHRPKIKNKHLTTTFPETVKWVNGSGQPMEDYFKFRGWRSIVRTVGYDWTQMNHYAVKSIDSYAIRKFRGNVNLKKDKYNSDYWALQDRNEVHDDSTLRYSARRDEIIEILLSDQVLRDLHFSAVERAEARLAEFKDTDAYADLVSGLKEASKVPIAEVVAKPPKARDPAKIAALMSEVEKQVNDKEKQERRRKLQTDWSRASDLYVGDPIHSHDSAPAEMFENKTLSIPADPRIFTPSALALIADGKFERNLVRRGLKLLNPGETILDVGAGVGFLAGVIAKERPQVRVVAQETSKGLADMALTLWRLNGLKLGPQLSLSSSPLVHPDDGPDHASGLSTLVSQTQCDILAVNDPTLTAQMLARAVQGIAGKPPKAIILGVRALKGEMKDTQAISLLADCGYSPVSDNPLSSALLLVRTSSQPVAKDTDTFGADPKT
jgi:hypothetical protein